MRNLQFIEGEFYHIYNRGVDKRALFIESRDFERFFESMSLLNINGSTGSLDRAMIKRKHGVFTETKMVDKLIEFIAYCINLNHFHLILRPIADKGVEKFMHKLEMSHSKYINAKYKRSGALFQGSFKAKLIDSNEYLLHLSSYVNLNHMAHSRDNRTNAFSRTSWNEYTKDNPAHSICDTKIVLEQFKNRKAYQRFAEESLKDIVERKILLEELEDAGIELINTG